MAGYPNVKSGMRRITTALLGSSVLVFVACGEPASPASSLETTTASQPTGSTAPLAVSASALTCDQIDVPYAPEDWYSDTPIYVGNEQPFEEVRAFAQGLDGFQDMWFDRAHNGWIGVGFTSGTDVLAQQAALEAEFPDVGIVAVEMPHTAEELAAFAAQIGSRLPADMDTAGVYEVQGYVEVWVGLLTPERIAVATEAGGDAPICLSGQDPATTPLPGPQSAGGEGWAYLAEADTMPASDQPQVIAEPGPLSSIWEEVGITDPMPEVDFEKQIVLVLVVGHSSSCPETRLDDVVVEDDFVYAVIPTITDQMGCTSDWVPRTYLVAVDRDRLPSPPFRLSAISEYGSEVLVSADLRLPGSGLAEGEIQPTSPERLRQVTPLPFWIETGIPWTLTIDPACGANYLGEINGVHWHRSDGSGMPEEWKAAAVDGLVDLELMMTQGPAPTLTASAGGATIRYLPGSDDGQPCA
ncbi:MAG TPA: hypothetical protein VI193_03045 [Acidimicrobiia bacterium]